MATTGDGGNPGWHDGIWEWFLKSYAGDQDAWSKLVDCYRAKLRIFIEGTIDQNYQARFDRSDVVQEIYLTMLTSSTDSPPSNFEQVTTDEARKRLVWDNLRVIARRRLGDLYSKHKAQCRDIMRERVPLSVNGPGDYIEYFLNQSVSTAVETPAARAQRAEEKIRMKAQIEDALLTLSEDDQAIMVRFWELKFENADVKLHCLELAHQKQISESAAAGRIKRAKRRFNAALEAIGVS